MALRHVGTPMADLAVGDTYPSHGTTVTVLSNHVPYRDRFGRRLSRFVGHRADTDGTGWVIYGPGGFVSGH